MKIPASLKFIAAVAVAYIAFSVPEWVFSKPVPTSLLTLYMIFSVLMILLVMTITDEGADELIRPLIVLLTDPSKRGLRIALFAILPLVAAGIVYYALTRGIEAPAEPRAVHPAPPGAFSAYNRTFNMSELENLLRAVEKSDPSRFKELVREGGEIYFKNCFFCHGAKLDGKGHYANALDPLPLAFAGQDTIAQLKESYVFWRIVKGGAGLPKEGAPWSSAMPAWEDNLTEDEVWRVVLFLYDYAGIRPRSGNGAPVMAAISVREADARQDGVTERGARVYERRCWWCHGTDGAGNGPAARFLNPAPRDFTWGFFKWKTTPFDEMSPSDDDLYAMIADGMNGTAMPGWSDVLGRDDIKAVGAYIKAFGKLKDAKEPPISLAGRVKFDKDSVARGRRIFSRRCVECHGDTGRGNASKRLRDDWGQRSWPRDLTKGWSFRGKDTAEAVYTRITVGIAGTQMPSFADPKSTKMLTEAERWDAANYVVSLNEPDKRPGADNLIRAGAVKGRLPERPDDAAWAGANAASFQFIPQFFNGEKLFRPTLDSISIKALHNDSEIAFLLEWDDPTKSVTNVKEEKTVDLNEGEPLEDAVAVAFPAGYGGGQRPYFGLGRPGAPVDVYLWKSGRAETAAAFTQSGFDFGRAQDNAASLPAYGVYDNGVWRVVVKRGLKMETMISGRAGFMPIAFAAWDGSNGDKGSRLVFTSWRWIALMPGDGADAGRLLWPLGAAVAVFAGEMLLLRSIRDD